MPDSPTHLRSRLAFMERARITATEMGLVVRAQEARQKALAHGLRGYRIAAEHAEESLRLYRADPGSFEE